MTTAEDQIASLRCWLREQEDMLRVRAETIHAHAEVIEMQTREIEGLRNIIAVLTVTEEAHRALSDKTQAYFNALAAVVHHLQPGASLKQLDRWDPPWPQVAEALRR